MEQDREKKTPIERELKKDVMPVGLKILEKFLNENGGRFFVGSCLTWADLAVAMFFFDMKHLLGNEILDELKLVKEHNQSIMNFPNIKAFTDKNY